jgi:hypothetical protein
MHISFIWYIFPPQVFGWTTSITLSDSDKEASVCRAKAPGVFYMCKRLFFSYSLLSGLHISLISRGNLLSHQLSVLLRLLCYISFRSIFTWWVYSLSVWSRSVLCDHGIHAMLPLTKSFRTDTTCYVVSNGPGDDREALHFFTVLQPVCNSPTPSPRIVHILASRFLNAC